MFIVSRSAAVWLGILLALCPGRAGSAASTVPAFSILTYNVKGNNATNWSTNMTQVQAIGRVLQYLQPDIITFNEIPYQYTWQMTNFVAAYLPGYYLATNSGTDGFIRSVIASRYEIAWSHKWLDGASLSQFGYTGNFTRDLFQAGIRVPGMPVPLNVFTTHLKATTSSPQADASKRAAEAAAISNFFVNVYLPGTNGLHPYLLTGDLNEDVERPDDSRYTTGFPLQKLVSPPVGLCLTTPLNPVTKSSLTLSIQGTLNVRFDYVLPDSLLFSNVISSQVFRSDVLTNPPPPNLAGNDSRTASDHLPVLMVFANPYDKPFRLLSLARTNAGMALTWESVRGQGYRVQASPDSRLWTNLSGTLISTGSQHVFTTNTGGSPLFFRVYRQP